MPAITNRLERFFFETLTQQGLDKVDTEKLGRLLEHLKSNELRDDVETPSPDGVVDEIEKTYLKGLLDKQDYRAFLEPDAKVALEVFLGLNVIASGGLIGRAVQLPKGKLTQLDLPLLPTPALTTSFVEECTLRAAELFGPTSTQQRRGEALYRLFADYAREASGRNQSIELDRQKRALLDAVAAMPDAKTLLFMDSDGDLFANAWELLYGMNPEEPEHSYPARTKSWCTYQNMQGSFDAAASKLDLVCAERGGAAQVLEHETRSALAWLIGDRPGNRIGNEAIEEKAISSTRGVDFCKGLFPFDATVQRAKLANGFDISVDFLDSFGRLVVYDRNAGDRMVALRKSDDSLVTIGYRTFFERDELHYEPTFGLTDGKLIPASEVKLVIQDASGRTKGDGRTAGKLGTGWWGFCDRNAQNALLTSLFPFEEPTKAVQIGEVSFSAQNIIDIVGRRLSEIFPRMSYAGYATQGRLDRLRLRDGTRLEGKLKTALDLRMPGAVLEGGDVYVRAKGDQDVFGLRAKRIVREDPWYVATLLDGSTRRLAQSELGLAFRKTDEVTTQAAPTSEQREELARIINDVLAPLGSEATEDAIRAWIMGSITWPLDAVKAKLDAVKARVWAAGEDEPSRLRALESILAAHGTDAALLRDFSLAVLTPAGDCARDWLKAFTQAPLAIDGALRTALLGDDAKLIKYLAPEVIRACVDEQRAKIAAACALLVDPATRLEVSRSIGDARLTAVKATHADGSTSSFEVTDQYVFWGSFSGLPPEVASQFIRLFQPLAARVLASGKVTGSVPAMEVPRDTTLTRNVEITLGDGTTRTLRSDEISSVAREQSTDIPLSEAMAFIAMHEGAIAADSWVGLGVSNGRHLFTARRSYRQSDPDAPEWVKNTKIETLLGTQGAVIDPRKVAFFELGAEHDKGFSTEITGWVEFDDNHLPINQATLSGDWDLLWAPAGKPDWFAPATLNPHVPNDVVLELYVNSVKDPQKMAALGLLPDNWRDFLHA